MMYSIYYQVTVKKTDCWYFTAILRSFEHLSFDRTLDKQNSIFEVLVAPSQEDMFLEIMNHFQSIGVVTNIVKTENRLLDPNAEI